MTEKAFESYLHVSNGGESTISMEAPYIVEFTIRGVAPILLHSWNNEAVEEKGKAKKGSAAKKTDNVDSYVYRNDHGEISLPSEYVRQAMIHAAKFRQDPRSPRKSAMDLFRAGIACLNELASLGSKDWDYLDKRRVTVQRAGITRTRPAFKQGWQSTFQFMTLLPEYIEPPVFHEVLTQAGRLIGIGDFRPSYGRFAVVHFEVQKD